MKGDTEKIVRTGKFLAPYDGLLAKLGCPSFSQPPPLPPRAVPATSRMSILGNFNTLRKKNQLIDVHVEAEGTRFPAHKVVLTASSDFCKTFFLGEWGSHMSSEAVIEFGVGSGKALTLSTMLDFAYGHDFVGPALQNPNDNEEKADNLDHMLDLLVCADAWQMLELGTQVEDYLTQPYHAAIYRRADNVEAIMEIAKSANANRVVEDCRAYIQHNKEGMKIMRSSS